MICVWSTGEFDDTRTCRVCVAGNFESVDPAARPWTAQAEPSSLLCALKLGRLKHWLVSKHDVESAFLIPEMPTDKLIIVRPPAK